MKLEKIIKKIPSLDLLPVSLLKTKENILQLSFPLLSDLLFLFLYGFFVIGFIAYNVAVQLFKFGVEITKSSQMPSTFSQMILQENAKPVLIKAFIFILLMVVITYILYCIFQGFSWWYCRKISGLKKQPKLKNYIKEFYKVNILWFVLFVIYIFISFLRDLMNGGEKSEPSIFMIMIFFVVLYFVLVSYSLLPKIRGIANIKKSFSIGIKKIADILPAYIIIFIVFLIIELLLNYSLKISNTLFVFAGVFLLMPAVSWLRVYFMVIVENLIE